MSLDFVFDLPVVDKGNTGILVFVCRLSKMVHLAPDTLFQLLGTKLTMSTAYHLQTDVSVLKHLGPGRTSFLWLSLYSTMRCTHQRGYSVLLEWVTTPPGAANLAGRHRCLHRKWGRGSETSQVSEIEPASLKRQLSSFIDDRWTLISRVRDAMALAQDKQKEYSDKKGRGNLNVFKQGELVLLDTKKLPTNLVSSVGSNKLKHRFIGPFAGLDRHGTAYTIDLPKSMATHPTFYVGRLKRYHNPLGLPSRTEEDQGENSPPRNEAESSGQPELPVSKPVTDTQVGTHASHTKGHPTMHLMA
ncbi:Pol protein [Phytophthora palmivora]|uniref:Pol protein n=1 Tax=Phytophthora palmivora TaxID=4796 RepID=A0A2P4X3K3_9STRA|nr:Pol protein [Phytophthora palmivora]